MKNKKILVMIMAGIVLLISFVFGAYKLADYNRYARTKKQHEAVEVFVNAYKNLSYKKLRAIINEKNYAEESMNGNVLFQGFVFTNSANTESELKAYKNILNNSRFSITQKDGSFDRNTYSKWVVKVEYPDINAIFAEMAIKNKGFFYKTDEYESISNLLNMIPVGYKIPYSLTEEFIIEVNIENGIIESFIPVAESVNLKDYINDVKEAYYCAGLMENNAFSLNTETNKALSEIFCGYDFYEFTGSIRKIDQGLRMIIINDENKWFIGSEYTEGVIGDRYVTGNNARYKEYVSALKSVK